MVELIPRLAFSDVSGNCLTPVWSSTPPPPSPSISITDDLAQYHIQEQHSESLLWAQPAAPSPEFASQGPLWYDGDAIIVPEIVVTSPPSNMTLDASQDPHQELHSEGSNFLLSPAGLFMIDLFPIIDDTIPPSSALYELSDDPTSARSPSTLFRVAAPIPAPTETFEDQHINFSDHSPDLGSSSTRASCLPPAPNPHILVQRTRRAKSNANPPTRHSPYPRPLTLSSPSIPSKRRHPDTPSPTSPFVLPDIYPIASQSNLEDGTNDIAKETVGTDAVVEASTRRRKRPGKFRCETCFANQLWRTFTSAHNLKSRSMSFLRDSTLTVSSHQII